MQVGCWVLTVHTAHGKIYQQPSFHYHHIPHNTNNWKYMKCWLLYTEIRDEIVYCLLFARMHVFISQVHHHYSPTLQKWSPIRLHFHQIQKKFNMFLSLLHAWKYNTNTNNSWHDGLAVWWWWSSHHYTTYYMMAWWLHTLILSLYVHHKLSQFWWCYVFGETNFYRWKGEIAI